jgi:hypothetical protein
MLPSHSTFALPHTRAEWNEEGIDVAARFARAVEISGADLVACVHSGTRAPAHTLVKIE